MSKIHFGSCPHCGVEVWTTPPEPVHTAQHQQGWERKPAIPSPISFPSPLATPEGKRAVSSLADALEKSTKEAALEAKVAILQSTLGELIELIEKVVERLEKKDREVDMTPKRELLKG